MKDDDNVDDLHVADTNYVSKNYDDHMCKHEVCCMVSTLDLARSFGAMKGDE